MSAHQRVVASFEPGRPPESRDRGSSRVSNICTLAAYLVWHLRQACAPLTFTDENRPEPTDPVAPARRSAAADRKAATKTTSDDLPAHSFTSLLDHLATLTRNHMRVVGHDQAGFDPLTIATPTQRRAFELINATTPMQLQ